MANNSESEHKVGGLYTLAETIRALQAASRADAPSEVSMILRALSVSLGTLMRDIELMNYLDTLAEETPARLLNYPDDVEYTWRIATLISGAHVQRLRSAGREPTRMHVRDVLRNLYDNRQRYPHARVIEKVDAHENGA